MDIFSPTFNVISYISNRIKTLGFLLGFYVSYVLLFWQLAFRIEAGSLYQLLPQEAKTIQFSSLAQSSLTLCDPMNAARQASLSITNSRSSLKLKSVELVMPSSHLILCCPLLLLPPIPPSIKVFSSESTLRMRWPNYWSFSFSIIPSKEIGRASCRERV